MINSPNQKATSIKTDKFGEVEVDPSRMLHFKAPIIGFDRSIKYALLPHSEESPFTWLQSMDEPGVSFIIIQAFDFFPEYAPDIDDADLEDIDVRSSEDIIITLLVTIPEDYKQMTANLVAPVIINKANLQAKQVIIKNFEKYDTKERIIKEA